MGDRRFNAAFDRFAAATDLPAAIRDAPDADLIAALAASSGRSAAPYFANVLATELLNRLHSKNSVLNTAGDGLVTVDATGRITYVNPAAERLIGFKLDEARDRDARDVLGCAEDDATCPVHSVARGGPPVRAAETTLRRRDGEPFDALATVEPLARDGVREGAVVAFHDVTEQRRAARELESHRRLLESLHRALDELGEGIALTEGGRLTYTNDAFLRLTGYDRDEALRLDPLSFVVPEDRERIEREVRRQVSGEAPPAPVAVRIRRKDGTVFPAEFSARLIAAEGAARVVTVLRDVSVRRSAEERILRSEARWRALVEGLPGYILTVNAEGTITFINRSAPGLTVDEILGSSLYSFFGGADAEVVRRAVEEVFKTGEPREYEALGRARNGLARWHHARVAPLDPGGDGRPREALVLSLPVPPPEGRVPQRS